MVLLLCCRYTVYIPHLRLPRCTLTLYEINSPACTTRGSNKWQQGKPAAIEQVRCALQLMDHTDELYASSLPRRSSRGFKVRESMSRGVLTKENDC